MNNHHSGLRDRTSTLRKSSLPPTTITKNDDVEEGNQQQQNDDGVVLQQDGTTSSSSPSSLHFLSSKKTYDDEGKTNNERIQGYFPVLLFCQIIRRRRCDGCGGSSSSSSFPISNLISWCQQQAWVGSSRRFVNLLAFIIFCFDPPFLLYGVILNFWLYQICQSNNNNASSLSSRQTLRYIIIPSAVCIMIIFAALAKKYEVSHKRLYKYDLTHVQKVDQMYYRMIPVDESYGNRFLSAVETISDYIIEGSQSESKKSFNNNKIINMKRSSFNNYNNKFIEKLPVSSVKSFDNAIRFDFLLEFRNNPQFTSEFGCLMETDFVVDTTYVTKAMMTSTTHQTTLIPSPTPKTNNNNNTTQQQRDDYPSTSRRRLPDFLHVQHMWAHRKFEPQNVGLLCVRNKKNKKGQQQQHDDAYTATYYDDLYLDIWLRMMSFLNNRRYCRLLPKSLLYWLLPFERKRILYWDIDHGCTYLFDHCNYIHFTKPKGDAMAQALTYIDREKKKSASTATVDKISAGYNGLKGVMPGLKRMKQLSFGNATDNLGYQ